MDPEIRREKVYLQPGMSTAEVMKTYGLSSDQAYKARIKGFYVKNYSKKQIIIDRENFNQAVCYPLAKKVFGKNFKRNALAQSLYDDMIQEAVTRLFELSGKTKEMANGKYSQNYAGFWVAHNAMLAFLKSWEKQNKWCVSFELTLLLKSVFRKFLLIDVLTIPCLFYLVASASDYLHVIGAGVMVFFAILDFLLLWRFYFPRAAAAV